MSVSFSTSLQKFDSSLWGYHLKIPLEHAQRLLADENRRVICYLNKTTKLHSALMPSGQHWFILINKRVREQLGLQIGQAVYVTLEPDRTEYGVPMPEEFSVLLDQDDEGSQLFHRLTPGKQRSLIYIVTKVKNSDSRINKALAILHHLKEKEGRLDFKQLAQMIKEYNQRGRLL